MATLIVVWPLSVALVHLVSYPLRGNFGFATWHDVFDDSLLALFVAATVSLRAAARARGREVRLRRAMEDLPFPAMVHAEDGAVVQLNRMWTEITGYTRLEIPTTAAWREKASGTRERLGHEVAGARSGPAQAGQEGELAIVTRDGDRRLWHLTSAPLGSDPSGRRLVISVATDVTERVRTERALEASQERLRALVQDVHAVLWEADSRGFSTFVSDEAGSILGYPPRRVVEQEGFWLSRIHPEDRARVEEALRSAPDGDDDREIEYRFQAADGRLVWVHDSVRPIRDESGRVTGFRGVTTDVTSKKEAELELERAQRQLRGILDTARDAIVSIDHSDVIVEFNRSAEQMFGHSRQAVLGKRGADLLIPPQWQARHREGVRLSLARGGSPDIDRTLEVTAMRADGSQFPAELSLSAQEVNGRPMLTACIRDLTERKQTQDAIEAAAREWTRTVDAIEYAILVLDGEGRIVRLNAAASDAANRSYSECLGRNVGELGAGEPWETAARMVRQADAGTAPAPGRVRDERTGAWWDLALVWAAPGREGAPRRILTARDVTAMVALEESVRRSATMAAMGALVGGVAHEVRNPLFAISVNIDALSLMFRHHSEVREILDALRAERDRLNELMADLLEYGKPQVASLVEGDLGGVICDAVRSCAEMAERCGATIACGASAGRYPVRMDRSRLQQVFENLLENACQHSGSGGWVRIGAEGFSRAGGAWVRCKVSDSGYGFPPEVLPRVFEPFFTRRRGGTGLGLAIAQRIVEEHGGRIAAANGVEKGAEVVVELPCAPSP